MRRLIGEDFSPWTEKACWALDHHGLRYSFRQYQPLIEEPWLRVKTKNFTKKATVPALLDGDEILLDSFSIARHAERIGGGAPLFPKGREAEIEAWNERSEAALRAGRALFFVRLSRDSAAQLDNLPPFVPAKARPLLRPLVRSGVAYLRAKHGIDEAATARAEGELDAALSSLRAALAQRAHLLGELSYADIAMAVVCQFVRPVDDRYIRLSPASRACWTHGELARKHEDILEWRDRLYSHRAW
jgi:glutathione S-transferase